MIDLTGIFFVNLIDLPKENRNNIRMRDLGWPFHVPEIITSGRGVFEMYKMGVSYAFWADSWDADIYPVIERAKEVGCDILEMGAGIVTEMDSSQRKRLKETLAAAGIEAAFCIGLSPESDVSVADENARRRGIELLKRTAEMMHEMEAPILGGVFYGAWLSKLPEGESDRRPYLERSVQSMKEVMRTAEDLDVYFHVEPVNRFEQFMINTSEEAVEYVKRVGSPNLRILLDTFHMNIEEDSIFESIETAGDLLGHLHLGEPNRRAPGRGRFPWHDLFYGLMTIKYRGGMTMEPFLKTGGQVGRDICVWRDLTDGIDLDSEARRALAFLRKSVK